MGLAEAFAVLRGTYCSSLAKDRFGREARMALVVA